MAYSPNKTGGLLGKILGGSGKTSIRASYGIFNTMIQGNTIAVDEPQPPYGLSAAVFNGLFASPYALAAGGTQTNPFPLTFPPYNARPGNPANAQIVYDGVYNPQSGMTAPPPWNTYPYTENYFFSIERQLPAQTVLSISYVGSEAHHLIEVYSNNPGNPGLCLALNQPGRSMARPLRQGSRHVVQAAKTTRIAWPRHSRSAGSLIRRAQTCKARAKD